MTVAAAKTRELEVAARLFEQLEDAVQTILRIEGSTGSPYLMDSVDALRKAQGQVAIRYYRAAQQ